MEFWRTEISWTSGDTVGSGGGARGSCFWLGNGDFCGGGAGKRSGIASLLAMCKVFAGCGCSDCFFDGSVDFYGGARTDSVGREGEKVEDA